MLPIIKLDETMTPTHVFVARTRSRRSSRCLIEPSRSDDFDFSVFGKGSPERSEERAEHSSRTFAATRTSRRSWWSVHHSRAKAKKPKADPKSISSSRTLAGQSGDRKRKRQGGENGDSDRERKRQGGESGDHQRKGGDRMQQQAAGREGGRTGGRAGDVEDKRKAGRAGDAEDKRKAGRAGDADVKRAARRLIGLTRSAAARRLHGHDDAATIVATTSISTFSSREMSNKAKQQLQSKSFGPTSPGVARDSFFLFFLFIYFTYFINSIQFRTYVC
jgi:hypothetical protein